MFAYRMEKKDGTAEVIFEGDVDIDVTECFEEELTPELQSWGKVQMDFSGVQFVDSSGIGLLITMVQTLKDGGSKVKIVKVNPEVQEIFSLLQLPDILGHEVFAD